MFTDSVKGLVRPGPDALRHAAQSLAGLTSIGPATALQLCYGGPAQHSTAKRGRVGRVVFGGRIRGVRGGARRAAEAVKGGREGCFIWEQLLLAAPGPGVGVRVCLSTSGACPAQCPMILYICSEELCAYVYNEGMNVFLFVTILLVFSLLQYYHLCFCLFFPKRGYVIKTWSQVCFTAQHRLV